ncbi:MAG: HdaA/DnaA family protein [Alphaproteobacteria bacterium]
MTSQIPLNLSFIPSYSRQDYVVNSQNKQLIALLDAWPNWQNPWLLIEGEQGAGKTHLAHIFAHKMNAILIAEPKIDMHAIINQQQSLVIDLPLSPDAQPQDDLFHLINHVKESQKFGVILIEPINDIHFSLLPDLRSRLAQMMHFRLELPNDDTLRALVVKLLSDRQLALSGAQIHWLIPRLRRSYAFVQQYIANIDKASLADKKKITQTILKQELENLLNLQKY